MKTLAVLCLTATIITIFEILVEQHTGFKFHPDGYKLVTYSNEGLVFISGGIFVSLKS